MPNKKKLGAYIAPHHDPEKWRNYLRAVDPGFIRVLMPGDAPTDLVSQMHQICPDAHISLRWWDLDDGGPAEKDKKLEDPLRSAPFIVGEMGNRLVRMETEASKNGLPFPKRDKLWFNTLNEPPTWQHERRDSIATWSWAAARESDTKFDVGMMCLELAVGHPEEWPPVWDWADEVMYNIIKHGGILAIHEYWQPEGPLYEWKDEQGATRSDWGALAGRYMHFDGVTSNVPIVITECGVDGRIYNRHATPDTGFAKFMSGVAFAAQLGTYLQRIGRDSRILSALPFITDYPDKEWASFDTLHAQDAIVKMLEFLEMPDEVDEKPDIHLPFVPGNGDDHYKVSRANMEQLDTLLRDALVLLGSIKND